MTAVLSAAAVVVGRLAVLVLVMVFTATAAAAAAVFNLTAVVGRGGSSVSGRQTPTKVTD